MIATAQIASGSDMTDYTPDCCLGLLCPRLEEGADLEVIAHLIEHQPFAKHEFAVADKEGEFSRQVDRGAQGRDAGSLSHSPPR